MAQQAHAQNLVTDWNFTATNRISGASNGGPNANGGMLGYNINATGWNNTPATNVNGTGSAPIGYNFLFTPASVNSTNPVIGNDPGGGQLSLFNNANATNGMTAPPEGGNFIAADGAYQASAITQTITNLVIGQKYLLSFYYAGAQQYGASYTSATTNSWNVTMSSSNGSTNYFNTNTTAIVSANKAFTGWQQATYSFTASNTIEVLSFLASGTPSGQPPFSLLANVSIVAVPEASTVIVGGLLLLFICAAPLLKSFKGRDKKTLCSTEGAGSGYP